MIMTIDVKNLFRIIIKFNILFAGELPNLIMIIDEYWMNPTDWIGFWSEDVLLIIKRLTFNDL